MSSVARQTNTITKRKLSKKTCESTVALVADVVEGEEDNDVDCNDDEDDDIQLNTINCTRNSLVNASTNAE